MSDKDAAKRRRQARNRQERLNRQKRIEGARRSAARPSRTADQADATTTAGRNGRPSRSAAPAPAPGGVLGKLFPPRPAPAAKGTDAKGAPARPARVPQPRESVVVEVDDDLDGFRGAVVRRLAQPGGRATFGAVLLAVAAAVLLLAVPIAPRLAFEGYGEMVVRAQPGTAVQRGDRVEAFADRDPVELGTQRLTELLNPLVVIGFALALLLVVGTAARSLDRPTRSRTLLVSSFAVVAVMFVLGQVLLPLVALLAFASYQSRKADRLAAVQGETA